MSAAYTTLAPALGPDALVGWLRWLVLLPLLGASWNATVGMRFERSPGERRVVHAVALAAAAAAFLVACYGVLQLILRPEADRYLLDRMATLLDVAHLHVDLALALDPLSATWALVITGVGGLIHVYALGYMAEEPRQARFFACLNLFLAAMLLLVLGDSLLSLFIGWEGVGLASFLLIGYWFEEDQNAAAATKAFLVNRVGDLGLVTALLALFWGLGGGFEAGRYHRDGASGVRIAAVQEHNTERPVVVAIGPTLSLREITAQLTLHDRDGRSPVRAALSGRRLFGLPIMMVVALGLLLAAAGKSAQWPLFIWLPDAMAGPTPVSALIHAATMVTAGIYLLCRLGAVFLAAPDAALVLAWLGLATALIGALAACAQTDLKRILAYSTISQLGLMLLGLGVGAPESGVFHVVTHACFKALLFLAAGAIIHAVHQAHAQVDTGFSLAHEAHEPPDPQDLRNMGGLAGPLPRTGLVYLIGCWAITGVPLAAGFYSKDAIFAAALGAPTGTLLFAGALLTSGLTAYYMFRSYYLVFYGRALPIELAQAVGPPRSMATVLGLLAALCLVLGPLLGIPSLLTGREALLARWLGPSLAQARPGLPSHGAELATLVLSLAVALGGWLVARARFRLGAVDRGAPALREALYLDAFVRAALVPAYAGLARVAARVDTRLIDGLVRFIALVGRALAGATGFFDRIFVDGAVNALGSLCERVGARLRQLESGRLNHYLLGMTIGLLALVMAASLW